MITNKVLFHLLIICLFIYINAPLALSYDLLPDIRMIRSCKIDTIYQLGDSMSDTGNRVIENPLEGCPRLPYGQNFFRGTTGRCSNGMLMIDYIALAAGIPLLNPYLKTDANFSHGVNFAVCGATALSVEALAEKSIFVSGTRSSLHVQLEWMFGHIDLHCRQKNLNSALFIVGEMGGNDYSCAFLDGRTIDEAKSMVPEVVQAITDAVRRVIDLGAVQVIVPGNFPVGCQPIYLTLFQTKDATAYDDHQCLKGFNDFSIYHNQLLQEALSALREENPNTKIVYADYYNAFQSLLQNRRYLGFDITSTLKACCGSGGMYSYSPSKACGSSGVPVCSNPNQYISWDGIHMTQKAYEYLAKWLVADFLPALSCNTKDNNHIISAI